MTDVNKTISAQALLAAWDEHVRSEFDQKDVEGTMATMVSEGAHLTNVPTLMGGVGNTEVRKFYSQYFIPQLPSDTQTDLISRTVGEDQIVDELIFKFTHSCQMDWMLPGVKPTYKCVEVGLVVIIKFKENKVAHEHIYWDQAAVLAQIGLLEIKNLPIVGKEAAQKLRDPTSVLSNQLLKK